jgi:glycosyltransferase involved in cell wall biosynthesis
MFGSWRSDKVSRTASRPLKIVYVITRMIVGGAQETGKYTAEYFHAQGDQVLLVTGAEAGAEGQLHVQVPTVVLPNLVRRVRPVADVRALLSLYRLFRTGRPDIVHSRTAKARFLAPVAARLARVPTVVQTIHGFSFNNEIDRHKWLYVRLERLAARCCHCNVVVSEADMEEGLRRRIFTPERATLIRSGVDLHKMKDVDADRVASLRAEYQLPGGSIVLLVGRLSPPKTPEVFIDAAARVVEAHRDARLLLVGDGPKRTAVEAQIERLGLQRNVLLLGLRSDVPELVAASDIVVHSSTHEGMPKTVLEGIAVGKPVIATAVGGVPAALVDGVSGLLVEPLDPEGLATAMTRLLDDHGMGEMLASAAAKRLPEFSLDRTVEDTARLYERLRGPSSAG